MKKINERTRKVFIFIFKLLTTLIILSIVFTKIDLGKIVNIFLSLNFLIIIPFIAISILVLAIMTLKWKIFLKKYSNIKFKKLLPIYWASDFVNLFGLGGVGGETYKTISFKNKKQALFSSLSDKFFSIGWSVVLIIAMFLSYILFQTNLLFFSCGILFYFLLSFFFILILIISKDFLLKFIKIKLIRKVLLEIPHNKKDLFFHSFLNLFFNFLIFIKFLILFNFVGLSIPYLEMFIFIPLLRIALLLPISIQGFGVREFMFLQFSKITSLNLEKLIAISFLIYLLGLIYEIVGIIPFLILKKKQN